MKFYSVAYCLQMIIRKLAGSQILLIHLMMGRLTILFQKVMHAVHAINMVRVARHHLHLNIQSSPFSVPGLWSLVWVVVNQKMGNDP